LSLQESYDNSGLQTGSPEWDCTGVLLTLDCTEEIIDEAVRKKCNLVVAHHPVIFGPLKKLTGANIVERTIVKAIKNDVAIYACHTNMDNVRQGVNRKIGEKLGLHNLRILSPTPQLLRKLVTFVPASHHQRVSDALFAAGCGNIGNYDSCSFNVEGTGTFRGNSDSNPFIGRPNELSREQEIRVESIFEKHNEKKILGALRSAHPYEEVAYDIYSLENDYQHVGSGMIGELEQEMDEQGFLNHVKKGLKAGVLKHTKTRGKMIHKVAICGGSGKFLLKRAISAGADAYITADFKYHEFFEPEGRILLVDAGHYETEQYTPELFYDIIRKKFSTFALHLSKINTNPVNYY